MALYKARYRQSAFDLVVQLYGDFSQIGEILKNIDDINGEIPLGSSFTVPTQTDPSALFFTNRTLIVQTDVNPVVEETPTFDSTAITFDSTEYTFDMTA